MQDLALIRCQLLHEFHVTCISSLLGTNITPYSSQDFKQAFMKYIARCIYCSPFMLFVYSWHLSQLGQRNQNSHFQCWCHFLVFIRWHNAAGKWLRLGKILFAVVFKNKVMGNILSQIRFCKSLK